MPAALKKILGNTGEAKAVNYLLDKGWDVYGVNVTVPGGELDIIAFDRSLNELVFVEVKTRSQNFSGDPADSVDSRKTKAFVRAGDCYAAKNYPGYDYRFDIIAITPEAIEHFENITFP